MLLLWRLLQKHVACSRPAFGLALACTRLALTLPSPKGRGFRLYCFSVGSGLGARYLNGRYSGSPMSVIIQLLYGQVRA